MNSRFVTPTKAMLAATTVSIALVAMTATFLALRYDSLPDILPVHFWPSGKPNGWQYKTYARVLMPVFVQVSLAVTLGTVAALLLSRPHGDHDHEAPDVRAAAIAAETVTVLALIWIAFQAYAGVALTNMWHRQWAGLGRLYSLFEYAGIALTAVVAVSAHRRLGRPEPRPFVSEHWRFGQLYKNPEDPALFVPTRDGSRWTLNFGRPTAALLMGAVLAIGVVGPVVILGILLRL